MSILTSELLIDKPRAPRLERRRISPSIQQYLDGHVIDPRAALERNARAYELEQARHNRPRTFQSEGWTLNGHAANRRAA